MAERSRRGVLAHAAKRAPTWQAADAPGRWLDLRRGFQPAFHFVSHRNVNIGLSEGLTSSASVRPVTAPSTTTTTTTTTTPRGARAV